MVESVKFIARHRNQGGADFFMEIEFDSVRGVTYYGVEVIVIPADLWDKKSAFVSWEKGIRVL